VGVERNSQLFRRILRLRRAERRHPDDRDIAAVRSELERELGDVLTRSMTAQILGLHHSSLQRWIDSEDLPLVMNRRGRKGIPIESVVALYEKLDPDLREDGPHQLRGHRLEPVILDAHREAERLDPVRLVEAGSEDAADPHRRSDRRSLAYHRAIARRLRRFMVDAARRRVWQWQQEDRIDPRYAQAWLDILDGTVAEVRAALREDSPHMRDLRQSSPFAGMLSEAERRKIFQEIR